MFEDFLQSCPMQDEIMPTRKQIRKNISAVNALIASDNNGRKIKKFRPLFIAAIALISVLSVITVSAVLKGEPINFLMGGKNVEGEFIDQTNKEGYRNVSFRAEIPIDADNFAVIFDIDAKEGENVRVITDETDLEFMNKLRKRMNIIKDDENDDIQLKYSELVVFELSTPGRSCGGTIGGEFFNSGAAVGKPSKFVREYEYKETTKILKVTFSYYAGN